MYHHVIENGETCQLAVVFVPNAYRYARDRDFMVHLKI